MPLLDHVDGVVVGEQCVEAIVVEGGDRGDRMRRAVGQAVEQLTEVVRPRPRMALGEGFESVEKRVAIQGVAPMSVRRAGLGSGRVVRQR